MPFEAASKQFLIIAAVVNADGLFIKQVLKFTSCRTAVDRRFVDPSSQFLSIPIPLIPGLLKTIRRAPAKRGEL